jgi:hypothetical protein
MKFSMNDKYIVIILKTTNDVFQERFSNQLQVPGAFHFVVSGKFQPLFLAGLQPAFYSL